MPITLAEERYISAGATRMVSVSFAKWLDGSASLTGTPTVVEVGTSALTLANKAVNASAIVVNGVTVAIGKAVQFSVVTPSDGAGTNYRVRVTATTNGSPAEAEPVDLILRCV